MAGKGEDRGIRERTLKTGELVFDVKIWHNGNPVTIGGYRSKAEARKMYRLAKVEQDKGTFDPRAYQRRGGHRDIVQGTLTLKQYAEQWLDEHRRRFKPTTLASYRAILKYKIIPALGHVNLTALTRDLVKQFVLAELRRKTAEGFEVSLTTAHNALHVISRVLRAAHQDGLIPQNPALGLGDLIGTPALTNIVPLSHQEECDFLNAVQKYKRKWYPFFFLILRSGLRIGEALALQLDDINFETRQIRVHRTWSTGGLQETTKSNKERAVDMSWKLAEVLREYIDRLTQEAEEQWKPIPLWLFEGMKRLPFTQQCVRMNIFKSILKKAKMRKFRIHDLRHTFASRLLLQGDTRGVTLKYVSTMLGHSSIAITADLYTHLIPGALRWAVDLLDEAPASSTRCRLCNQRVRPTAIATTRRVRPAA